MNLTSHLPQPRRAHVEERLQSNLMAWLTAVRPDGRPGLDVTDLGRDSIRIRGGARPAPNVPPADQVAEYAVKYAERIAAMLGTPAAFARAYSQPLIITPRRLSACEPGQTSSKARHHDRL